MSILGELMKNATLYNLLISLGTLINSFGNLGVIFCLGEQLLTHFVTARGSVLEEGSPPDSRTTSMKFRSTAIRI
jgi:hypothetical protein